MLSPRAGNHQQLLVQWGAEAGDAGLSGWPRPTNLVDPAAVSCLYSTSPLHHSDTL
ncbi:unnamed protein product [Protopolystoma xenopodis]|uniref:Uncharacterized protein n=1 Tax=Protopolystoma xenopodis TaxID=117903 RepID=A0A448X3M3_9PLAT|nr:unnamed protein product [Protopolystoma xenopodis]